ncbi:SO_0444 family Cu/Zn efflux transporter [Colwellia sp. 1_MG-2023]|uniref:SO_0444 family Cu/Zn efflux transporter n=1 Tax=Colwellia sp. 1_MG-2023 TaxID=3062649 RepID=UPI0026E327B3|nr:SO_0444 family Cu/Zn efflux transporter [Colwellia sp. 1_MG-2023]MDO6444531.1 SO_0444 family Cu/Zn efflux transporter [Colwellia sp. 1_MG-2023]
MNDITQIFNELVNNFLFLSAEASPWLLLGLIIAGMMKAWAPTSILSHHLGKGKSAIVKAALIGAPLPLCSCGVIPVATELRRSGASSPATASFLVATPETGVDSITVSYALLGPIFAIYRPISAILSAIITGLLVTTAKVIPPSSNTPTSCCASKAKQEAPSCCDTSSEKKKVTFISKTLTGLRYAVTQLIDDLIIWLLIGLIFATLVKTFVPTSFLLSYGSGLPAMLLMIAISIPMYICATASTPIAAGFILAGISPGTALVFMMAGPATNISTLGIIKKEMGMSVLIRYLIGIGSSAIAFGLLLDWGINYFAINISQQMQHNHEMLPYWFGLTCAAVITFFAIKPLRNNLLQFSLKG